MKESPSLTPRKPFTRSPGRASSMSRLDQLAKPRIKTLSELSKVSPSKNQLLKPLDKPKHSSVTRSMSHLAVSNQNPIQPQRPLHKTDSLSMHQLSPPAPLPPPRMTRAIQLRQQKLINNSLSTTRQQSEGKFFIHFK